MIFSNQKELLDFFNRLNLEESTLVFKPRNGKEVKEGKSCGCDTCQCGPTSTPVEESVESAEVEVSSALIESYAVPLSVKVEIAEDVQQNVFYVEDYDKVPNTCGTGKIQLPGKTFFMNMCEEDGKPTISLSLKLDDGRKIKDAPFVLEKSNDANRIILNKKFIV